MSTKQRAKTSEAMRVRPSFPNCATIFYILICLKIILTPTVLDRNIFDYLILGFAFVFCIIGFSQNIIIDGDKKKVILPIIVLIVISFLGLRKIFTYHSITCIIALVGLASYISVCAYFSSAIQASFARPIYIAVLIVLLARTASGEYLGNTLPGAIFFLTLEYVIVVKKDDENKGKFTSKMDTFLMISFIALMVYICIQSNSRTPIIVCLLVVIVFILFGIFRPTAIQYGRLFWIILLCTTVGLLIYIKVSSFEWYKELNNLSVAQFGKNINSGRPYLWREAFRNMSPLEIIMGRGTGALPSDSIYYESSFHNSFIQLTVQSGIVGLACLLISLKGFWDIISRHPDDFISRFILACFVGILVYNCFESTLLQNKFFLGLIQWLILCQGIVRSHRLDMIGE